jgi:hypothetical protein
LNLKWVREGEREREGERDWVRISSVALSLFRIIEAEIGEREKRGRVMEREGKKRDPGREVDWERIS